MKCLCTVAATRWNQGENSASLKLLLGQLQTIAEKQADGAIKRQEGKITTEEQNKIRQRHQTYARKVFNSLLSGKDKISLELVDVLTNSRLNQAVYTSAIQNHAEMKIYDSIPTSTQSQIYIGISKLCCKDCISKIALGEKNVVVRGAHFHDPKANAQNLPVNNPEGFAGSDDEQQNNPNKNKQQGEKDPFQTLDKALRDKLSTSFENLISAQLRNAPTPKTQEYIAVREDSGRGGEVVAARCEREFLLRRQ